MSAAATRLTQPTLHAKVRCGPEWRRLAIPANLSFAGFKVCPCTNWQCLSRANRAYRRLYLCSSSRMQSFMQREFPMPHAVLYESRDGAVVLATEADYAGMLAAHAAAAPTPSGVSTLRLTVEPLGPAAPLTRARPPVAALHFAVAPPSAATQPRLPTQSQYETWRSGRRFPG